MTIPSKYAPALSVLNHLLAAPDILTQIQSLPAPTLLKLVNKIGLEDSSEILALASGEQLCRIVDEDLWSNSGKREEFQADRFVVWLRALEEMGYKKAAEKLSELDEDFLGLSFGHFLFVLELEAVHFMRTQVQGDSWSDDRLEKILEGYHSHEFGDLLVLARPHAPWETLLPLLLALDDHDGSLLGRVLQRIALAGEVKAEREGGLYEVLSSEEMLESDSSFSRDQRRIADGYVPANDAAAFTAWVQRASVEELKNMKGPDPVSRGYFRDYRGLVISPRLSSAPPLALHPLVKQLLEEEDAAAPSLRIGGEENAFAKALAKVEGEDRDRILLELNFLAQVVMQTEKRKGGPLRAADAAGLVMDRCGKGFALAEGPGVNAIQAYALGMKVG